MFPILETERLVLREINKKDASAVLSILSNDEVTRYYGQETLKGNDEADRIIDLFATNYNEKRGILWEREVHFFLLGYENQDYSDYKVSHSI